MPNTIRRESFSLLLSKIKWQFLLIVSMCLLGIAAPQLAAQSYLQSVGVPSFTAAVPVENGFINLNNGNLHLEIPLGTYPQRGGHKESVALEYDSDIWTGDIPLGIPWTPTNVPANFIHGGFIPLSQLGYYPVGNVGWRLVTTGDVGFTSYGETDSGYCPATDDYKTATYSPFIYSGPDGTAHTFNVTTIQSIAPACPVSQTPNASGYAADGSGYFISVTSFTNAKVYAPDGTVVNTPTSLNNWKTDPNGNLYKQTWISNSPVHWKYYDTTNRTLVDVTMSTDGNTFYFAVPNAQGSTSTYTVKLGMFNYNSIFGTSAYGSFYAVSEIDLPDTTKYTFTYDSGTTGSHYGVLSSMTLPTGGQISYSYATFTDAYGNEGLGITHRTTPDSSTGWSYGAPTVVSSCAKGQVNCQQTVTDTKPSGDNEVYTFTLNGGAWLTQEQTYNGSVSSANLLSTTTACYSFVTVTSGQCSYAVTTASPAINVHKLAETTTLPIPGSSVSKTTEFAWDTNNYGNLITLSEWNFGSSLSGAADRTTSYGYLGGSSYISANILNRPSSVIVTDKNGNPVAKTFNCYDYATGCGSSPLTSSFGSASGKTNHDDTNYSTTNTVRGDLTQIQRLVSGSSTYLTKSMRYDMTGQLLQETDWSNLLASATSYDYTDHYVNGTPSGPTNAYPTTITAPLGAGSSTETYYYGTGQLASITDANNQATSFTYADFFNRLTNTSLPNGGWTITQYDLSTGTPKVPTGTELFTGISGTSSTGCSNCRHDQTVLETAGLGRIAKQLLVNDPDTQTEVDTTYDSNGRVMNVSHPYRYTSDPTYGLETPTYDGLDRTWKITHNADSNVAYTYSGASITGTLGQTTQQCSSTYGKGYPILMIDEVGNKIQSWTDGFGRLIEADEPDSTGALNKKSCYAYDMNNNRTGMLAADGSQTRSYSYDLLSRLTSQTDPETKSTTTNFAYTASGGGLCSGDPLAICQRTDGRSITTTYTYDALNRLTGKSYSDSTPAVTYSYDQASYNGLTITNGKGRRTGMSDGSGQTAWSYDAVGNALAVSKKINGQTKTMSYTYNLDGSIATIQYPGGRTIIYATSNAQRSTSAKDNSNSINYALSAHYAPQGALASVQDGSSLISTFFYNNRLELCRISVKNTGTAPTSCANTTYGNVLDLTYSYGQSSYYGSGSNFNNGNIASLTNNLNNNRTQTYTYDPLNRLLTAQSTATSGADCWGQGFGSYNATSPTLPLADDVLNNQLLVTSLKCSSPAPNWSVNSYNQIWNSGYTFGNSGGNTADGGTYTYTYDAENRLTSVVTGSGTYCYKYDGNDLRDQKGSASSGCSSPTWNELYWRDTGGNTIAETDGAGSITNSSYNEYVGFAGQRIAQSNPYSGNVYYYVADHLGSTRVVTNALGSPCYGADFLPYGSENTPSGFTNSCSTNYKFTGYERDPETGNDYAFARYYSQREERFLSPDPLDGSTTDPQTLNKYTYVRNNPTNLTDPSGLLACGTDCGSGEPCGIECGGGPPTGCIVLCIGGWNGFGNVGGGGPEGSDASNRRPVYTPPDAPETEPSSGDGNSNDPWSMGCESLGMPCGMQFPGGGGIDPSGCTYGGGSCGGMIYGLVNIQGGSGQGVMDQLGNFMFTADVLAIPPFDPFCDFGGDVICSSGQPPQVVANIQSDNATNFAMAGVADGVAEGVADALEGLDAKVALHEAHHTFWWGERMRHIQITIWRTGVKGSGINIRIPWPW
jgi:RHS repeat-associated protein